MSTNLKEVHAYFKILDQEVFGTLQVNNKDTLITFKSKTPIPPLSNFYNLTGTGFDHKIISCLQCVDVGVRQNHHRGGTEFSASVFPHYVSIGDVGINLTENSITNICFTTDDLPTLFNDRSAFGHLFGAKNQLQTLLIQNHEALKDQFEITWEFALPEIAETPHLFYWTGKTEAFKCSTAIGVLTVTYSPSISSDGKSGVNCENKITANLAYSDPISFEKAIDNISTFSRFFSIVAGRTQNPSNIQIKTLDSPPDSYTNIYCSYSSSVSAIPLENSNDIPLSPIHRPDEFSTVLQNWIDREQDWRIGRIQNLNGLNKNRSYDTDRLVSAANSFDILPSEATIANKAITKECRTARDECIRILEMLPNSEDRAAAIGVMKRWGRANLRSKILHRAEIVKNHIPQLNAGIDRILILAIKTRNYFVHGSDNFKYEKYEDFLPLFTDALEFVFSASDIIECGWEPKLWLKSHPSYSHNYSHFINSFKEEIDLIKLVNGEAKHWPIAPSA